MRWLSLRPHALRLRVSSTQGGTLRQVEVLAIAMRSTLPIHYSVYLADCASKKAASANVETLFSGAGKLAEDATTMHDDLLGAYVCNHVNWECEWLRPTVHDVACSYLSLHGADGADHGAADDEDEEDAPF